MYAHVVYLLIPTSNHNAAHIPGTAGEVVYLLIPTSNHNQVLNYAAEHVLFIS